MTEKNVARRPENNRDERRRLLKIGAIGAAAVGAESVGLTQLFGAPQAGRGRGRGFGGVGRGANAEVSASEALPNGPEGFPYHLDGCKTFGEYKQKRKQAGRPCEPVVVDASNPSLEHEMSRCRNCGRCDEACMAQTISHWYDRGTLKDGVATICVHCGQCVTACRSNILHEKLDYPEVWAAISDVDRKKTFVATTAPAIRVSLGEMFDLPPGENLEKKIAASLRKLGFDRVFDVAFGADLTTEEETRELWERLNDDAGPKPLFTSCCPGWVSFVETFYPEAIPLLSTTRSPIFAQSAALKTKFAKDAGIDPESLVCVAFVPCVGKKFEATRPEANGAGRYWKKDGIRDLDYALTTRELASWLYQTQIDPTAIDGEEFDSAFGKDGAGKIFGATGGVAGSVLRNLWKKIEKTDVPAELVSLQDVRGVQGLRETTVEIGGKTIRAAVVCGLSAARPLLETFKTTGKIDYDFVEVMACPGGCVGGGGQPKIGGRLRPTDAERQARADGLFKINENAPIKTSGDNPEIQAFYRDFLGGDPDCETAKTLLRTTFAKNDVWK